MENEKASDTGWKERLDLLAGIPGEPAANREATWQRLQERRQKAPRRKSFPLYWLAAAAVLLTVFLPRFLPEHPEHPGGKPKTELPGPRSAISISREQQIDLVMAAGDSRKKSLKPLTGKPSGKSATVVSRTVQPAPVIQQVTVPAMIPGISGPADTVQAIALVPGPKKLRVVHINELGSNPGESAAGRMAGAPYLQARLANPEAFSRFTISRNSSDNILKINISPSN